MNEQLISQLENAITYIVYKHFNPDFNLDNKWDTTYMQVDIFDSTPCISIFDGISIFDEDVEYRVMWTTVPDCVSILPRYKSHILFGYNTSKIPVEEIVKDVKRVVNNIINYLSTHKQ